MSFLIQLLVGLSCYAPATNIPEKKGETGARKMWSR